MRKTDLNSLFSKFFSISFLLIVYAFKATAEFNFSTNRNEESVLSNKVIGAVKLLFFLNWMKRTHIVSRSGLNHFKIVTFKWWLSWYSCYVKMVNDSWKNKQSNEMMLTIFKICINRRMDAAAMALIVFNRTPFHVK